MKKDLLFMAEWQILFNHFTMEKEAGEETIVFDISMAILKVSIIRCFLQPSTCSLGYLDDWWIWKRKMEKLKIETWDFKDKDIVSSILLTVIKKVAHLEAQVSFPLACIHKVVMLLFEQTWLLYRSIVGIHLLHQGLLPFPLSWWVASL